MGRVIGIFLETGIGGSSAHITKVSGVMENENLELKGNIWVTHWGLYPAT